MSTNIIISTMTSRRMRRGKKDVESRVRAFTSCHWHPPLNPSCHVLPHPHNLSPPFAIALCLSLTSRIFQIWFLFVVVALDDDAPWADADCHMEIFEISRHSSRQQGKESGGVQGGEGKATITQYIVIYPVAIRQSLRLHLQPFLCVFLSCCSSFLFSFFFGKLSWNVLACILVHMCSPRIPFSPPLGCFEKITSFRFQKSQLQIIMFASFTTLIRCCCALCHDGATRGEVLTVLAKGFDIKIWWHVVISAPCRCLSSPSVRHSPPSRTPLFRLASLPLNSIRFHSILAPPSPPPPPVTSARG